MLRIGVHYIAFFDVDVVMIVNAEEAHGPFDRFKCGFAAEQIKPDRDIVRVKELIASTEKLGAVRESRAHTARRGQFARLELEEIFSGDVKKNVLTVNRR